MKRNFTPELKKKCILRIVDDDPDIRKSLSFLLRANGWNARAYEGCAEFIVEDSPSVPGCLILDVRMPDKSGLEIQQLLNDRNYQIPFVFLTGHGDIEMAVHAMQQGAVDFLQKPVDSAKLLELIEKYCLLSARKAAPLLYLSPSEIKEKLSRLSDRETQIVELVREGLTSKIISGRLGLSEKTVENHRISACKKVNASNIAEIIRLLDALGEKI